MSRFCSIVLVMFIGVLASGNAEKEIATELLENFYRTLIPATIPNGSTLDSLIDNTNCELLATLKLEGTPAANDPDAALILTAKRAYCQLVDNGIALDRTDEVLIDILMKAQIERMKFIIQLHTGGMYTSSTPNPTEGEWLGLIAEELEPSSFGIAVLEITKVIKARDELIGLGLTIDDILAEMD